MEAWPGHLMLAIGESGAERQRMRSKGSLASFQVPEPGQLAGPKYRSKQVWNQKEQGRRLAKAVEDRGLEAI